MARDPLALTLLKFPFVLTIAFSKSVGRFSFVALQFIIRMIIYPITVFSYRSNIFQAFLCAFLNLAISLSYLWVASYILTEYIRTVWHPEYLIFSVLFLMGQGMIMIGGIRMFSKNFPQEDSEKLSECLRNTLTDLISLISTLLVLVSVIGIPRMKNLPIKPDLYHDTICAILAITACDLLELPFILIQIIAPWRLYLYLKQRKKRENISERIRLALRSFLNGVIDLPLSLLVLVLLVSGLYTRKMFRQIKNESLTRLKTIVMFIEFLASLVIILISLANIICVVRAPAVVKSLKDYYYTHLNPKLLVKDIAQHTKHTLMSPYLLLKLLVLLITVYKLKRIHLDMKKVSVSIEAFDDLNARSNKLLVDLLKDALITLILTICLVFVWRSVPFFKKFDKKLYHKSVLKLFFTCLLDIPAFLVLCLILMTVVRVPLLYRKRNSKTKHAISLLWSVLVEVIKDVLILPFICIKIISPVRLIFDLVLAYNAFTPKQQRKVLARKAYRVLEDYLTVLLSLVLLVSVWRGSELLMVVWIHFKQIIKREISTSSLFRKVLRLVIQLLKDIITLILMILSFLMIIEAAELFRRIRVYYYLYRERKGFYLVKTIKKLSRRKEIIRPSANIHRLKKNVFAYLCSFLDVKSLGNLASTCSYIRQLINYPPIWRFHYENNWKEIVLNENPDKNIPDNAYKKMVIDAYLLFKKQHSKDILDEQARDFQIGLRSIISEEFMFSIIGYFHILAIPTKILAYYTSKINYTQYISGIFRQFSVVINHSNIPILQYALDLDRTRPKRELMKSFYHVQMHLFWNIAIIFIIAVEFVVYHACRLNNCIIIALSNGNYTPFNQFPGPSVPIPKVFYYLQLVYTCFAVILYLFVWVVPTYLCYVYCGYNIPASFIGPGFINLPFYYIYVVFIITTFDKIRQFNSFRPHYPYYHLRHLLQEGRSYNVRIVEYFKKITRLIKQCILVFSPNGFLMKMYKKLLFSTGRLCRQYHKSGNLIYSFIVLLWISWPIMVPYFYSNLLLLLPAVPLSTFFLLIGYPIAEKAWQPVN